MVHHVYPPSLNRFLLSEITVKGRSSILVLVEKSTIQHILSGLVSSCSFMATNVPPVTQKDAGSCVRFDTVGKQVF